MSEVFDTTRCILGEGPLWHPTRQQLFWFDVLSGRLYARDGYKARQVQFDEMVSAAGWVSDTELLIASESRLFLFDIEREKSEDVEGLEPDDTRTRSNDGRADPWGGFWISTMAKDASTGAGAIYRYFNGKMVRLFEGVSVPNAISFTPNRKYAYYTDTPTQVVMRQPLEPDRGWPEGDPEPWLDLSDAGLFPDGAVVDAEGVFWNAQWRAARVAAYDPNGELLRTIECDALQTTCPAFGGPDLSTLYCTSAVIDLDDAAHEAYSCNGMTFAAPETGRGQAEHRVRL